MASSSSPSISGMQPRQRSISLPSKLSDLSSLQLEADLGKLRTAESSRPLGLKLIQEKLLDLADLYISSEEYLTQTTSTQQTLLSYDQGKLVKDALTLSDQFLAILSTVREVVASMKDQLTDLESAIRRRGGCTTYVASYVNAYMSYRKKSKKEVGKGLKVIKQMEHGLVNSLDLVVDSKVVVVFRVMREVALATAAVLKSLLVSLSLSAMKVKGWSVLISKLMVGSGNSTKGSSNKLDFFNEVAVVDITLSTTFECKDLEIVQGRLRTLDDAVRGLESTMDCVYRRLVQSRVTFLNMLINSN